MEKKWLAEIEKSAKRIEFSTFLIGVVLSSDMDEKLDEAGRLAAKAKIKRELGMALERKWKKLGRTVDFKNPEAVFTVNLHSKRLQTSILPLFIYGRYLKPSRKIPQSRWPCGRCNGRGCAHCDGKGVMYEESVESLVGAPLLRETGATATKMHAAGREDIDARMLGTGRPFVLELENPQKRNPNLKRIEKEINEKCKGKAEAHGLRLVGKDSVLKIKSASPPKTYSLLVACGRRIAPADIAKIRKLAGKSLAQRTPERVLHRRADLERKRKILALDVEQIDKKTFRLTISAEAGMYIKEFVTGDKGRTRPSISQLLCRRCVPSELDVTSVDFRLK